MWTPLSAAELNAFLIIFVAMALNSLPAINDYWSAEAMLGHHWIKNIISRDRFKAISRNVYSLWLDMRTYKKHLSHVFFVHMYFYQYTSYFA